MGVPRGNYIIEYTAELWYMWGSSHVLCEPWLQLGLLPPRIAWWWCSHRAPPHSSGSRFHSSLALRCHAQRRWYTCVQTPSGNLATAHEATLWKVITSESWSCHVAPDMSHRFEPSVKEEALPSLVWRTWAPGTYCGRLPLRADSRSHRLWSFLRYPAGSEGKGASIWSLLDK